MSQHVARKRFKQTRKMWVIELVSVVFIAFIAFYAVKSFQYQNKFLPQTNVAGVDVSGKTVKEANRTLVDHFNQKEFAIMDKNKQLLSFTGKQAGVNRNFTKTLADLKREQKPWEWSLSAFAKASDEKANGQITLDTETFNHFYDSIKGSLNKGRTASTNATIDKSNGQITIVKETQGNTFDEAAMNKKIKSAVNSGSGTIQLSDLYVKPTVKSTDEAIVNGKALMDKVANETVTYAINGNTEVIPKENLFSWLTYADGKVTLDNTALSNYVNSLATKYNTYSKARQFNSTKRGPVTVPAGTYGWSINQSKEVPELTAQILKGESFTREPEINGVGYNKDKIDLPNSYVEVDLVNQHMWVYQNGQSVLDTDIVSGKPGQDTPPGVWSVWSKQRNATLRGFNSDGSKYASPVNYWMPIDATGVGLHDSPWQPKYGGDWWTTHGSHGCINTPPDVMAKLFDLVPVGTPVLVF